MKTILITAYKLFQILLTNAAALITFYIIYKIGSNYFVEVSNYYFVPLSIIIIYIIKEDIQIIKQPVECYKNLI